MTSPNADGPDISHHNPVADWDAIPQYRLFSTKATEGRTFRSPTFDENWRQMRRRRFEFRGCYHWIRSDSPMADQVANLVRALSGHGGLRAGEFIQLDWETTPGIAPVTVAQVEEWVTLAERHWPGRIIVYASDWVPGFLQWRARHPSYPIWYANYNTSDRATGGWAECAKYGADVWQWTSSAPVPGIADPTVDQNHVFKWDTLHRITLATPTPPTPPPIVQPTPPTPPPIVQPPPPQGALIDMFRLFVTNAPTSPTPVTVLLCDGTQLSHVKDGYFDQVLAAAGVASTQAKSAEQTRGTIISCVTKTPCPPEWVGTTWETLWNGQRG